MSHGVKAGWYRDPLTPDQIRWWDGTRWSQSTRSTTVPDPAAKASPLLRRALIATPIVALMAVAVAWLAFGRAQNEPASGGTLASSDPAQIVQSWERAACSGLPVEPVDSSSPEVVSSARCLRGDGSFPTYTEIIWVYDSPSAVKTRLATMSCASNVTDFVVFGEFWIANARTPESATALQEAGGTLCTNGP